MPRLLQPLVALPLAKLVLHLATFRGYGYFRDELYYLACSERLALGYVDHPPLSIALLAAQRALFGDSLLAVRFLPAVAGALTVLVVGLLARDLGGGRFARTLAMVGSGLGFLFGFHVYSMNAFDVLVWATAAWLLVRILELGERRLWPLLGLLLGLGLLNKISVLWLGAGLFVGLLAESVAGSGRRPLADLRPWLAGGIAAALFLPHLLWQNGNGWPTLEFIRNATGEKMIEVSPLRFLQGQLGLLDPALTAIWIVGLGWLLLAGRARRVRPLAWTYLTVFVLLMVGGSSRSGYLGPAYTWLLPAGAVAIEAWLARRRLPLLKEAVLTLVIALGLVWAPFALPLLPVDSYIAYAEALGVAPGTEERKEVGALPQHYADMHGWREIVDTVAGVYHSLPPPERREAAIFTPNYGDAGAIDLLGRDRGLPPAISGHNNYWLWGPRGHTGEVMIVVGGSEEGLSELFEAVELAARVDCGYCMPYEDDTPVWIARGLGPPLAEVWPALKHYD